MPEEKTEKKDNFGWKGFVKDLAIAIIIVAIITIFFKPTIVKESSMEATLYENHYLIVYKMAYKFGEPSRGDIIVFHSRLDAEDGSGDSNGKKLLIKRVIGLPGDHLEVKNNKVYINGKELKEKYTKDGITPGNVDQKIPKGQLFCMGDNRVVSLDSRDSAVGNVNIDDVMGKVVLRLYPFNQIGTVD